MKIVLIIYGISWAVLIIAFIVFRKKGRIPSDTPWFIYAITLGIAPLVALFIPYLFVKDYKETKEQSIKEAERNVLEARKSQVLEDYEKALELSGSVFSTDFLAIVAKLHSIVCEKKYNLLLSCMNKLSLPSGAVLEVEEAKQVGTGDRSRLHVENDGICDVNIWNYIKADASPMGAWQTYLLHNAWHSLSMFWHGIYNKRSYIYSAEDYERITFMRDEDSVPLIKELSHYDPTPIVINNGDKYYISACYWSNWGGLKRELIEITIVDHKVIDIFEAETKVMYPYDCGIRF